MDQQKNKCKYLTGRLREKPHILLVNKQSQTNMGVTWRSTLQFVHTTPRKEAPNPFAIESFTQNRVGWRSKKKTRWAFYYTPIVIVSQKILNYECPVVSHFQDIWLLYTLLFHLAPTCFTRQKSRATNVFVRAHKVCWNSITISVGVNGDDIRWLKLAPWNAIIIVVCRLGSTMF